MLLGPGLGTLAATREPMHLCLSSTRCGTANAGEYFDWEDAKNAKLRGERGIGFEDVVFNFQRGDLVDTGNNRILAVTAASASSSSGARSTCTSCRSWKTSTQSS